MRSFLFCIAGGLFLLSSCKKADYQKVIHDPELYRITVKKLNDIVLENNFPPVTASRNYAYANIAAYQVVAAGDPAHFRSLVGQIKHLPPTPVPSKDTTVDYEFESLLA